MFSIANPPAKQSVTETLLVLSGRLNSATLLEDRRAAILGLRSFAKQYPATVASGSLKTLIETLRKDGEDIDTSKIVLETLLMLFHPNEDSIEASPEILLWLADEFTQRQENITLLLDLLELNDFYCRLYTLQLLVAISSARAERTEECVFTAPLGISRLVAVLEDGREAVRNEAILLLTHLTSTSSEIQKLAAFESAFERLLAVVKSEGELKHGGQVVEDCFILLANLLRLNASNQSLFRETGFFNQLSRLLEDSYNSTNSGEEDLAPWAKAQGMRNAWALLAVVRLFLLVGAVGTAQNQNALWQTGVFYHALQLAFSNDADDSIRAEALATCADAIRGNPTLQESFAGLQVPGLHSTNVNDNGVNGSKSNLEAPRLFVIDALLDLTLGVQATSFDIRLAASECIEAYCSGHNGIREHFLQRAIDGHRSGTLEKANVLTTLLHDPLEEANADPYRIWFAAVVMLHLIADHAKTKEMLLRVSEGDESKGEDVVTSMQTMTSHMITAMTKGDDARVVIGYQMLLCCWMFEDLDGVNDFLSEGSNLQRIAQVVQRESPDQVLERGLCAALIGIVYEFSTKDSPITRATLQPLILTSLGRDRFVDRLSKLRASPFIRDFEILPRRLDPDVGQTLPDVFFDVLFVNFFKDHYSRISRAIDRDPNFETPVVMDGVQKGISRDLVDSLRAQVVEKDHALEEVQVARASLERQLGQEQADSRRLRETTSLELSRIRNIHDSLQLSHAKESKEAEALLAARDVEHQKHVDDMKAQSAMELQQAQQQMKEALEAQQKDYGQQSEQLRLQMQATQTTHERQLEDLRKKMQSEADRVQRRAEAEMADLRATISRLDVDLVKANKSRTQELQAAQDELNRATQKTDGLQTNLDDLCTQLEKAQRAAKESQEAKDSVQGELDDLLMVYSDLEEKVAKYKERLKDLDQPTSDVEDEDDEDDADDKASNGDVD